MQEFTPAHRLYESFGFTYCGPFGDYLEDPNSIFMSVRLQPVIVAQPLASSSVRPHN